MSWKVHMLGSCNNLQEKKKKKTVLKMTMEFQQESTKQGVFLIWHTEGHSSASNKIHHCD